MKRKIWFALILGGLVLTGCKPTEKNYKAAYDAAIAKRDKVDSDGMLPADGLLQDDGPKRENIGGESLYALTERTNPLEQGDEVRNFSVAVAVFKMPTNARAGVEALKQKGFNALAARARGDKYYILAGSFETAEEARDCYLRFMKEFPEYSYIGLPGVPVILRR